MIYVWGIAYVKLLVQNVVLSASIKAVVAKANGIHLPIHDQNNLSSLTDFLVHKSCGDSTPRLSVPTMSPRAFINNLIFVSFFLDCIYVEDHDSIDKIILVGWVVSRLYSFWSSLIDAQLLIPFQLTISGHCH